MDCCQYCDQVVNLAFLPHAVLSKASFSPSHLRCDGSCRSFWSRCHSFDFPQLSAISQNMEARGARHLWLTCGVGTRDERYQHVSGPNNHLTAYADGLESSDGDMEKNRSHFHLGFGLGVSLTAPYYLKYLLMCKCSVCAITITRLVIAARLSTKDFTYDLARLAIVTDLEPLLGIIVACAPMFPPTLKAALNRKPRRSQSSGLSSGFAKLNSKSARSLWFRSADDSYPLKDVEGVVNHTQITGPNSRQSSFHDSSVAGPRDGTEEQPAITVKTKWEIKRQLAR